MKREPGLRGATNRAASGLVAVVFGLPAVAVGGWVMYGMLFGFESSPPSGNDRDPAVFDVEPGPPDARPDLEQNAYDDPQGSVPLDGCVIKGNVAFDTGELIYHVPGQAHYDETVIREEYGERWFCTEDEAVAAGWRKSEV